LKRFSDEKSGGIFPLFYFSSTKNKNLNTFIFSSRKNKTREKKIFCFHDIVLLEFTALACFLDQWKFVGALLFIIIIHNFVQPFL